ncbi:MAG: hypothetical protein IKP31_03655 [Lachnospiraceae bacterium]|nr:hypothetical protein [Lachnospiraceae bacterium]
MREKIKKIITIPILVLLLLSISGCVPETIKGIKDTSDKDDWKKAEGNTVGAEAYRRVDACGDYHFDAEGRVFCGGGTKSGQWILTDEKAYGEEYPNRYDIGHRISKDSYIPGEVMYVDITFRLQGDDVEDSEDIWGAIYFADMKDGSRDGGPAVRQYFRKLQNEEVNHPVEMSHFGRDNDGRKGSSKGNDGDIEYRFTAFLPFPRLCAEEDRIYAVLDISDGEGKVLSRYIREYTFKRGEDLEYMEEESYENNPEFTCIEHPGRWDMTDIRFIGGDDGEIKDGDIGIKAERYGVEGGDMVYTYRTGDGSYCRIRVPDIYPDTTLYAGDKFMEWIRNTDYQGLNGKEAVLHCSLAFSDVDFDSGKHGVKVEPRVYLEGSYSQAGETFDAPCRLNVSGIIPEGDKDGDKIYLAYGVMDGFSGNVRMYNIYEYTYTKGPVLEWIYNPPMYD